MIPLQIPNFLTLDQPPSWCNAKGGIDRSACIEIKVSELRRLARCVVIDPHQRDARGRPLHAVSPLPDERDAVRRFRDGSRRLTSGSYSLRARQLHELHRSRLPRTLAGDFRTSRAPVMRNGLALKTPFRTRVTRAHPIAYPADRTLPGNPNKGACRTKIIGLDFEWSQPIRIEKWLYPNRIRPAYFMICPCGFQHKEHKEHREHRELKIQNRKSKIQNHCSVSSVNSVVSPLPPLSTRPPGREHPSSRRCPQRCLKLMMVQCTDQEYADAQAAQLWIASLPARLQLREPYRSFIHKLQLRYGPIFEPRMLTCPRCVGGRGNKSGGVRYGNHPETVRQGWRRRHGKPDTSIAGNPEALYQVPLDHWGRINYEFARAMINDGRGCNPTKSKIRRKHVRKADRRPGAKRDAASSRIHRLDARARKLITEGGYGDLLRDPHANESELIALARSLQRLKKARNRTTRSPG